MKTRMNKRMVMMVFTMIMAMVGLSGCIVTTPTVTNTIPAGYAIPECNIRVVDNYIRYQNVYPGDRNYVVVKATNVGSYRYYGELVIYAIYGGNMIELGYRSVSLRPGETKNLKVHFDTEYFCMGEYIIVPSFNTDRGEVMYYDPNHWYNNMIMSVSQPRAPFGEPYFCHHYYAPVPGYFAVPPRPSSRPAHYGPVPPKPHYYDTPIYGNNYPSPAGSATVARRQSNTAGSMSSRASGGNSSGSSSAVVNRPSGSSSSSSRDRNNNSNTVSPRTEGSTTSGSSSSSSSRSRDNNSNTVSPRTEGSTTAGSSSSSSSRVRDNNSNTVSPRTEGSTTSGSSSSSSSRSRDNNSNMVSPRTEGSTTSGSSSSSSSRGRDNDSNTVSSRNEDSTTTSSSSSTSTRQRSGRSEQKSNSTSSKSGDTSGTTRSRTR